MRAFLARLAAPIVIGSVAFMGTGVHPAAAAPALGARKIAGTYTVYFSYVGPYNNLPVTLTRKHSGTDIDDDQIVWSSVGRSIELDFSSAALPGATATFLGTVTKTGFDSAKHPGTFSNSLGDSGVWYAVKNA